MPLLNKLLLITIALFFSSCRAADVSEVKELAAYPQTISFISRTHEVDPSLVLNGDLGENAEDGRIFDGAPQYGNVVVGPGKSVKAVKGIMTASIEFDAQAWRANTIPLGIICIGSDACDPLVPGTGKFTAELLYRSTGSNDGWLVAGQRDILVNGTSPHQTLVIASKQFVGDADDMQIRIRSVDAENSLQLKVYSTNLTVSWQPH